MTDSVAGRPAVPSHISRWFVVGYGAAQAGAFISFIPLLSLLLPEKAAAIAGPDRALLLSQVAMMGGLTAAGANLLFGALSDRTRSRFGRRRPWIVIGFVLVAAALMLIGAARDPLHLMLAVMAFQLAVNALYAPLTALVPDLVPDAHKGLVSAWAGAALPVANLFTAVVVARLSGQPSAQVAVVILAAGLLILPFAFRVREPALPRLGPAAPVWRAFVSLRDPAFRVTFSSRLLAESAVAINTLYLLFWLQGARAGDLPAGWSAVHAFGVLLIASTLAATLAGFGGGLLSDRIGRRRGFVIAGAVCMAVSLALLVAWPEWPGPLAAQILFGAGHGLHATTVAAMTAEILPDPAKAGRDLGVMNMAVALPQSFAPALAATLLALGLPLSSVFVAASFAALAASVVLLALRRTA